MRGHRSASRFLPGPPRRCGARVAGTVGSTTVRDTPATFPGSRSSERAVRGSSLLVEYGDIAQPWGGLIRPEPEEGDDAAEAWSRHDWNKRPNAGSDSVSPSRRLPLVSVA